MVEWPDVAGFSAATRKCHFLLIIRLFFTYLRVDQRKITFALHSLSPSKPKSSRRFPRLERRRVHNISMTPRRQRRRAFKMAGNMASLLSLSTRKVLNAGRMLVATQRCRRRTIEFLRQKCRATIDVSGRLMMPSMVQFSTTASDKPILCP